MTIPGAVIDEALGVARHYGQPIAEARALEEGRAIVDLSHDAVLTVSGADRLTWLNSMTSQRLDNLAPGESRESLVLSPQGRVEHAMRVVDRDETTWLLVDQADREGLLEFLLKMRFAMRVEVEDRTSDYAQVLAWDGPALEAARGQLNPVVEWNDPWPDVSPGGHSYAAPKEIEWKVTRLVVPRTALEYIPKMVASGDVRVAGLNALDALEIHAWRVGKADVDERALPHELDWMRTAVHLNKGCYRGQETVAKVHNLGHPPRRLAMLHLIGADGELPEPGTLIRPAGSEEGARPVGRITRAGLHHDWGPIALAILKRTTDETATLELDLPSGSRCEATQDVIVPASAGATRQVPRLPRLG